MAQTDVITTRSAFRDELRRDLLARANDFYRDLSDLSGMDADADESNGHGDLAVPAAVVQVLTRRALIDLVNDVFEVPLPPPSAHHAEVSTPATIIVAAECPKCGIAHPISVKITPELLVDPDGSELRIKAKAKGRTHVCGQLALPDEAPEADGQQAFGLTDAPVPSGFVVEIVADAAAPTDIVVEGNDTADCPTLGEHDGTIVCHRPFDHEGDHYDDEASLAWRLVAAPVVGDAHVEAGEVSFGETLPDVEDVLGGEVVEDDDLLPGGPAVECVGSNHVPGCEHFVEPDPDAE